MTASERTNRDGITGTTAPSPGVLCVGLSEVQLRPVREVTSNLGWTLKECPTCVEAMDIIRTESMPIVFCSQHLADGDWRKVFHQSLRLQDRPKLVVVAPRPECSLWAEALHVGVYELLLLPLDGDEVERVISFGWESKCSEWGEERKVPALLRAGTF